MAGKIIADQIEHSTAGSLDTSYVVNGSAKAWVNMNATSTTDPASTTGVRDSLNVASILDIGSGGQTVNTSSSMSNADYVMTVNQRNTTTIRTFCSGGNDQHSNPTSSAFDVAAFFENSLAYTDPLYIWATVHGDLA